MPGGGWTPSPQKGYRDLPMEVPCGKCSGCLLDRSKEWAVRCIHEASQHVHNCFLTLTYEDSCLPVRGSLSPRDITLFLKRLRKHHNTIPGSSRPVCKFCYRTIRFFQCGEYGDLLDRPHHHVLLFGYRPDDLTLWKEEKIRGGGTYKTYRSTTIERLWPYGFVTVGEVTYETAAYTARYILKKVYGPDAESHYVGRHPEYTTMSRRPGIGKKWLDKYSEEVYRGDTLVYGLGKITKPPRYYDKLKEKEAPDEMESIKRERRIQQAQSDYNSPYRLKVREKLQEARLQVLERILHNI